VKIGSVSEATSAISVDGLYKSYGDLNVLKGINLKISRGEFYALMGRNGSGKTTLASIITCTKAPTRGHVSVHGHDVVCEANQVKKLIGYVPQENFSCPGLTGVENLVYFARLYRFNRKEAETLARELLDRMGLTGAAHRRVSEYSGGMRKRLEVATALFPGIEVLVLDEPTTGLDPSARKGFMSTLKEVNEEGVTVFLVTHIGEDAGTASRVGFIDEGVIMLEGAPDELKDTSGLRNVVEVDTPFKGEEVASVLTALSDEGQIMETGEGYRVFCRNSDEATPKILRALDGIGCQAIRVEVRVPSLEDVFFKATSKPLGG
jgi:ABC-2 type transport system ATP-binding protein